MTSSPLGSVVLIKWKRSSVDASVMGSSFSDDRGDGVRVTACLSFKYYGGEAPVSEPNSWFSNVGSAVRVRFPGNSDIERFGIEVGGACSGGQGSPAG